MPQVFQPTEHNSQIRQRLEPVEPTISYSSEIELFYNNDFKLTFEEDLQTFYTKLDTYAEHKSSKDKMLSANDLCHALTVLNDPAPLENDSSVKHFASNIKQPY